MIDIKIPKEIRAYKEKIYFGLTGRQMACTILALVINIPLYLYTKDILGQDLASWCVILISIPFMAIGFIQYQGMNFEVALKEIIKFKICSQRRIYSQTNFYEVLQSTKIENERKLK